MFDFMDEYLDIDDIVKNNVYNLPCAIEVRYYKNKELYRISNSFINEDRYTKKDIEELSKKIAKIEANKFIDRFFHGSWSSGNITTEGNLIDFDTSTFVRYRFPQYSNTINFKSNYFGYELLGQKLMINSIIENSNIEDVENFKSKIETLIDNTYEEHLKIKFCDLIGLNYEEHYNLYKSDIDYLCNKFNILCRKFLPNYYETNIGENNGNITSIFDFQDFSKTFDRKRKNKI